MDHEDPRSEAAAKSRRSARRERQQDALDPVQVSIRAITEVRTTADRMRKLMRFARRRRQVEHAERAFLDSIRPVLIVSAPNSLAGVADRLRLIGLADDADALVIYLDE